MDTSNPLADLKDVHLPQDSSIFPLAYGWYIVIAVVIMSIIIALLILRKRKIKNAERAKIEGLLNAIKEREIPDNEIIEECSVLLKRVAVMKFADRNPHLLFANKWLEFLDETGKTTEFTAGHGKCLVNIYRRQQIENKEDFFNVIRNWLRAVL